MFACQIEIKSQQYINASFICILIECIGLVHCYEKNKLIKYGTGKNLVRIRRIWELFGIWATFLRGRLLVLLSPLNPRGHIHFLPCIIKLKTQQFNLNLIPEVISKKKIGKKQYITGGYVQLDCTIDLMLNQGLVIYMKWYRFFVAFNSLRVGFNKFKKN